MRVGGVHQTCEASGTDPSDGVKRCDSGSGANQPADLLAGALAEVTGLTEQCRRPDREGCLDLVDDRVDLGFDGVDLLVDLADASLERAEQHLDLALLAPKRSPIADELTAARSELLDGDDADPTVM